MFDVWNTGINCCHELMKHTLLYIDSSNFYEETDCMHCKFRTRQHEFFMAHSNYTLSLSKMPKRRMMSVQSAWLELSTATISPDGII